jgi:hypothetical protein
MRRRFFSVLFSAALLVVALPLAAGAQEGTAEETTVQVNDAAKAGVEATTSNVSAETGNGSSSGNTGSQQSSDVTVSQAQTTEGTQSKAVTGDLNITQNSSSSCKNPDELGSLDNETSDDSLSFTSTGDKFRVSYDVDFDINGNSNEFRIEIRRNGTKVDSDSTTVDVTNKNFIVSKGSDTYDLDARIVQAPGGATYSVTVDDCRGSNQNHHGNNRHHHNRHHHNRFDHNRHHNNRFHHNRHNNNANAVTRQYESTVEDRVIKETIPNKGRLAATGGIPLAGVGLLSLALVGLGFSILRSANRRDS